MSGVNSVPAASISFLRDYSRPRNDKPSLVHLPTEIWLMVTEYLRPADIKDLSLASRAFRSFTIPSLFSKLVITKPPHLDAIRGLEKLESRLKFYTSVAIAPFVRTCYWESRPAGAGVSLDAVMVTYLPRLPRLFNLTTFACEYVELDRERIETLRQLHKLKSVRLHRCGFSDTLKDTTFDANRLESLTIESYFPWPFLTSAPDSACHLRELQLSVTRKSLETYIHLLYHCPRLETLVMKALPNFTLTEGTLLSDMPVPSLPMLKVFHGAASYMAFISGSGCSLHDVSLYCLEDRTALQVLAGALHAQHLRSLAVTINSLTAGMLEPICDLAALETLDIEILSFGPPGTISTRADLVDALTSLVLPPKLQSIRVESNLFGDEELIGHDIRRLEGIKDQNEGLTYLEVLSDEFHLISQ